MIIIGLTGSIGMGKSTVGAMLRKLGVPLFDADAAVHELYAPGGEAVPMVGHAFPEAIVDGAVDRAKLSKLVLGKPDAIKMLEAIVHPLVGRMRKRFLDAARARGEPFVVLDIPLLFEGSGRESVDRVVVVSAPADAQRERVLARPGMSPEKFAAILAQQVPDAEKRAQADLVINTGVSLAETEAQVRALVESLRREAEQGSKA